MMQRIVLFTLVMLPAIAMSDGAPRVLGPQAISGATSISAGSAQNSNTYRTDIDYSKLAPPVAPAPMVSSYSPDVCLGSVTGGVSGGGFGISAGSTTLDNDCVQRRDIRLLHNLGHSDAALAMACQDAEMGAALRQVGKCPKQHARPESVSAGYQFNDEGR